MTQTATTGSGHTHITVDGQTNLTVLINSSNPTQPFTLPQGGGGHTHTFELTQGDVDTLRAGGQITGKVSSSTNNHTHTYTISCG
jgi:hypothetical protein